MSAVNEARPGAGNRRLDTKRIQFEFPPEAVDRLERIKHDTSAGSYAEVVRNALRVYEWIREVQSKGYDIGVVKDDQLVKTVEFLY
jgi:hypothetical protein